MLAFEVCTDNKQDWFLSSLAWRMQRPWFKKNISNFGSSDHWKVLHVASVHLEWAQAQGMSGVSGYYSYVFFFCMIVLTYIFAWHEKLFTDWFSDMFLSQCSDFHYRSTDTAFNADVLLGRATHRIGESRGSWKMIVSVYKGDLFLTNRHTVQHYHFSYFYLTTTYGAPKGTWAKICNVKSFICNKWYLVQTRNILVLTKKVPVTNKNYLVRTRHFLVRGIAHGLVSNLYNTTHESEIKLMRAIWGWNFFGANVPLGTLYTT